MPVSIAGTPAITTFSAVASGNANFPATVNAGELLTLDFSQTIDVGITTPSGWTSIGAVGDGYAAGRAASFYKVAAGTEGGTTLALTFGASCDAVATITRHSGFDSTTPINGTPTTNSATSGSTTAITSPSVTTSVNNCLVRRLVATSESTGIAVPSGQTDGGTGTTGDTFANSTNRVGYSTQSTAGATGTVTFVSTGTDRAWVAVTYAIAPSAGGGAPVPVFVHNLRQQGIA